MSDKTKKLRDEAMIARRSREAEAKRKPDPIIKCQCGYGIYDRQLYGCQDKWGRATYHCIECLPEDLRELVRENPLYNSPEAS